jgi:hypothetical protein
VDSSLNLAVKYVRMSSIHTKACITKSHEACALLRYYTALSGNSLLSFQDNLSITSSRVKKSKREREWSMREVI